MVQCERIRSSVQVEGMNVELDLTDRASGERSAPAGTSRQAEAALANRIAGVAVVMNALVIIAAGLGLAGSFGWHLVGTACLMTGAGASIAINAAALQRTRLVYLPYVGAALSCLAFAMLIVVIWFDAAGSASQVLRPAFIALTIGLSSTYASVLAVPRLRGFAVRARNVGYVTLVALGTIVVAAIATGASVPSGVYTALGIVLATVTIMVMTGAAAIVGQVIDLTDAGLTEPSMVCPSCAEPLATYVATGHYSCQPCGLGFDLQVTAPPTR